MFSVLATRKQNLTFKLSISGRIIMILRFEMAYAVF